ncbi:aldo/keto reductase [Treponema parvum]|uniref:Aldo/keto reductase n=1 Tax=Treponema parvum TaxID=138851 RepID=A0A975F3E7_9SPIR|nr:aldo/keto reductase [Treponema parvum]QTQ13615.1 aldo/keto reductase [Treponema parvum]
MKTKKLGFGFMRLPIKNSDDPASVDIEQVKIMVDRFLENGFTYFDTAWMYHSFTSEEVLREALVKRHSRNSFTVATKMPVMMIGSKEEQKQVFEKQTEKTGADYFDYYLLHCLNEANYERAVKYETFEFLSELKKEGRIRRLGFSYHDKPELLDRILSEHPETEFVQLQINYLDWESESVCSRKNYEVCIKHSKPVIVMEPVKGGTLVNLSDDVAGIFKKAAPDMSLASWSIRFAASLPNVDTVLSGMSDASQVEDNVSYMKNFQPLSDAEKALIDLAVQKIKKEISIPCTACRYCVDGCPKHIPIPDFFMLYNKDRQINRKKYARQQIYYTNLASGTAKASQCIVCKRCEKICPQKLPISDLLKDVAQVFEHIDRKDKAAK